MFNFVWVYFSIDMLTDLKFYYFEHQCTLHKCTYVSEESVYTLAAFVIGHQGEIATYFRYL